jgi:16S rRNA C967 or C1407 C5-methylase (RsmB/RsmF family)
MQEFDLSKTVLDDIIDHDTPFSEALRKVFQNDVSLRPLRNMVAGLVGCELRHHLLFAYLSEPLADFDPAEKRFLALALADAYFFKRIPMDQLTAILHEKLGDAKMAKAQIFLDKAGKTEEYIPPEIPKTSNKYLSLRYNTPEWVLKIWEHYGYGTTYKILKKNNRQNTTSVRVRTSLMSVEELLNGNPDYAKTSVEGILCYGGKVPLRKLEEARQEKVFAERPATKAVLDKFKVEEPSEAFLFSGNADSSILKEMIESYGSSVGVNLGVYDVKDYVDVTKMIKGMGLKNVNFFGADPAQMDSAISRPQDLVVCAPNSSNFDLIREYPDYLLHFKKEGMDELFAKEKALLEGTSKFVAEHGTLLYMIYTISKKEGHQTIGDFLLAHPEFKLVREAQLFPYEDLDTALYYAVMKKETPLAKVEPPLGEAGAKKDPAVSVSAAQSD